jgi:hypothetical protein
VPHTPTVWTTSIRSILADDPLKHRLTPIKRTVKKENPTPQPVRQKPTMNMSQHEEVLSCAPPRLASAGTSPFPTPCVAPRGHTDKQERRGLAIDLTFMLILVLMALRGLFTHLGGPV